MENLTRPHYDFFRNASLFILRIIIAIVFLYAGIAKWIFWSNPYEGMSESMINLVRFLSIVEPLGAAALIIGFLTRWAALGFAVIMLGAIFILSLTMNTAFFTQPQAIGWDYNLVILGASLIIAVFGAGKWSLDYYMKKD